MPKRRRRRWAIGGDILILAALAVVVYLARRRYLEQSVELFWVYAGVGLVLLIAWVLVLIAAIRSGPSAEQGMAAELGPTQPESDGQEVAPAPDNVVAVPFEEPAVAQPVADHTPMVAADQAVGYGWAKASDLARAVPPGQA